MNDRVEEAARSGRTLSPELRQAAAQHAPAFGVSDAIHPDDFIFWYIHDDAALANKLDAAQRYLQSGRDTAALPVGLVGEYRIHQVLAQGANPQAPLSLLDFASGYGRVTRHFPVMLPGIDVTGCDIHQQAVDFMKSLGLQASRSATVPEQLALGRQFDVIFSFSFFTHMPRRTWGRWLRALAKQLTPHGVLIFTAHGEVSQKLMDVARLEPDGFFFHSASEQLDLDQADYGNTVTTLDFVNGQIAESGLKLLLFREAGAGHHDVYVVRQAEGEPIYHPAVVGGVSAEHCALRAEIEALRNSTSWKLTAPLRAAARLLGRP